MRYRHIYNAMWHIAFIVKSNTTKKINLISNSISLPKPIKNNHISLWIETYHCLALMLNTCPRLMIHMKKFSTNILICCFILNTFAPYKCFGRKPGIRHVTRNKFHHISTYSVVQRIKICIFGTNAPHTNLSFSVHSTCRASLKMPIKYIYIVGTVITRSNIIWYSIKHCAGSDII